MATTARLLVLGAATLFSAACAERVTSATEDSFILDPAFVSLPTGFGATTSSFSSSSTPGDGGSGAPFIPGASQERHEHGKNGLIDGHDFMGGGLGRDYMGGPDVGRPFDGDRVPASCTYAAGVTTCTELHNGLTITRSTAITSTTGAVQTKRDSLTDKIVSHSTITGTTSRRPNTSTVVNHVSDRTVTGLAKASAQRSVDGKSSGTETTTGTDTVGSYVATRVVGDTVSGLKVPVADGKAKYPVAGTVIRAVTATVTYTGKPTVSRTRREVITYDGSATATLVITKNGTTKTCKLPLPHGKPVCE